MYSGVPMSAPVCVIPGRYAERAMPKSITYTRPPESNMMFWGFKSR